MARLAAQPPARSSWVRAVPTLVASIAIVLLPVVCVVTVAC